METSDVGDVVRLTDTIVEPFEKDAVIKSAKATNAGTLQVSLSDGREQTIQIENLSGDGRALAIDFTQTSGGQTQSESTTDADLLR
jgi:hypothetical protein